ncbi:MAG: hypothetical protein RDV41_07945, partial [Planctomycetota bacterium]|nr:hypothetical protein [Planctomycetota bacterium]
MRTRPDKESGLALVLVLMVLAALVAVATPFLVSMVQHESSSRNYLDNVKARIAAENARNAGIVSMMRTHESFEIGSGAAAPFDDPEVDTLDEIGVSKDDIGLPKDAVTLDSRGLMWDAHAEDEQGKINLRTAPRHVVENLLKIVDPKTAPLEKYT